MFSVNYSLVYVFLLATMISFLEIQIEGKDGWAKNLPCWRANPDWLITKFYSLFQGGKEVTGYHLTLNGLEVFIFHMSFFAGVEWSLAREIQTLSCLPLFWVNQDFLWFVWNPNYGLKKFKPGYVWWHKKWTGPIPIDYIPGMLISGAIALIGAFLANRKIIIWWAISFCAIESLVLISCILKYTLKYTGR